MAQNYKKNMNKIYIYLILVVISITILYVSSQIQNIRKSTLNEYYYTKSLRSSYTIFVASLFFIISFISGFLYKVNPWIVGISMNSIFLLATFYEMTVFKGSHNLLPAELVIYFFFSLPSILGSYLGLYINRINPKRTNNI
jgi:hypothetical protein